MTLIFSIIIGILLLVLLYRLFKAERDDDTFVCSIIFFVTIASAFVCWYNSEFKFNTAADIINIVDSIFAVGYVVLFIVKKKKAKNDDEKNK